MQEFARQTRRIGGLKQAARADAGLEYDHFEGRDAPLRKHCGDCTSIYIRHFLERRRQQRYSAAARDQLAQMRSSASLENRHYFRFH